MQGIYSTLVVLHIFISFGLLALIVFQKTSGEGLLTTSNKSNFMSGDEVASFLTKLTAIFAFGFIVNTIAIAAFGSKISKSINLTVEAVQDESSKSQVPSGR